MGLTTNSNFALLLIVAVSVVHIQGYWQEYEIIGFQNGACSLFKTNLRVKRYEKSNFAISGTVEVLRDFNNEWQTELNIFYSSMGNNQFVKMPYRLPRDDACNMIDGIFVKYGAAKDWAAASDFPEPVINESLCASYKAGNYTVHRFAVAKSIIPTILQPGYYKVEIKYSKKLSNETGTVIVQGKLY